MTMRIMIHSNGPMVPSGYGNQVRLLLPQLERLGHEPIVSAFYGLAGSPMNWRGYPILPAGRSNYGLDTIIPHAQYCGADVTLTLMDFWKLGPIAQDLASLKLVPWVANDCHPLGAPDRVTLLNSRAFPMAMSQFGARNLAELTPMPLYVPHAVDTRNEFYPQDRDEIRRELGFDDRFVVGMCSANRDAMRKGWPEQLRAFSRFHAKHPDSVLMVHTVVNSPGGLDLIGMVDAFGLTGSVGFSEEYPQVTGLFTTELLRQWYNACDVFLACSYAEAFCVPLIEAQACGTPVITTDGSAMHENVGPGWLVAGHEFWNPVHQAWWTRPDPRKIERALESAYEHAAQRRAKSVEFAEPFDIENVTLSHWLPALDQIEEYVGHDRDTVGKCDRGVPGGDGSERDSAGGGAGESGDGDDDLRFD